MHAEVCDVPAVAAAIRKNKVRPGVSVNPDKPVSMILQNLQVVDLVLVMTVFAGFGGQKFIPETLKTIAQVDAGSLRLNLDPEIAVDGGINDKTAEDCAACGANVFVAGSYIFGHADFAAASPRFGQPVSGVENAWGMRDNFFQGCLTPCPSPNVERGWKRTDRAGRSRVCFVETQRARSLPGMK